MPAGLLLSPRPPRGSVIGVAGAPGASPRTGHSRNPSRSHHSRRPSASAAAALSSGSGFGGILGASSGVLRSILSAVHALEANSELGPASGPPVEVLHHSLGGQGSGRNSRVGLAKLDEAEATREDGGEEEKHNAPVASPSLSAVSPPTPARTLSGTPAAASLPIPLVLTPAMTVQPALPAGAIAAVISSTSTEEAASGAPADSASRLLQQLHAAKIAPGENTIRALLRERDEQLERAETQKQQCMRIVQLPAEVRTPEQREQLLAFLRSQNSFLLKELQPHVLAKLCERVGYACYRPGSIVFKQGAPSDAFYICVTGSVSIWINPPPKPAAGDAAGGEGAAAEEEAEVFSHDAGMGGDEEEEDDRRDSSDSEGEERAP